MFAPFAYTLDAVGNRIGGSEQLLRNSVTYDSAAQIWNYDAAYQLTLEKRRKERRKGDITDYW